MNNKQKIKEGVKKISKKDFFYLDKLYFLILPFKKVVRLEKSHYKNKKEILIGLEGFPYVLSRNYIYVGKTLKAAKKAENLTNLKDSNLSLKQQEKKNILLGDLYGYPKCCSQHFIESKNKFKKELPSQKFYLKINNKLIEFSLLHQPCSRNCSNSQRIKKFIINQIKKYNLF